MSTDTVQMIADALQISLDLPTFLFEAASPEVAEAALREYETCQAGVGRFKVDDDRFLLASYDGLSTSLLLIGPYRTLDDPAGDVSVLSAKDEARATEALRLAAGAALRLVDEPRLRLELAHQMELLSSAIIAISSELDLDTVLRRLVDLARDVAGARYAALGVPNERNELEAFITSGLSPEVETSIGSLPQGRGILGLLLRERRTVRIPDISAHPESFGFPAHHPPMKSFLGVPITSRDIVLGSLYLTEKRFGSEFTAEDERLVELLARHAAVAIENANLYQQLGGQRRRLQLILDSLPEGVIVADRQPDRIPLINRRARELLGLGIAEPVPAMTPTSWGVRIFKSDTLPLEETDWPLASSLRDGEVVIQHECLIERPNGSQVTLLANSAPLHDEEGKVTSAVCVFQDITQIKDADQLKDDFLSLVSHELRTPLTTIHGGAHMLLQDREHLDAGTVGDLLTDIYQESGRLAALIETMVQLAHIRAGKLAMDTEPILIRSVVDQCVESMRDQILERPLEIVIEPGLVAEADAQHVDEILRNLIQNAVKYTPAGSPLHILGERTEKKVRVAVRDYGEGIPEEDIPLIFDRFQRGKQAESSWSSGMGLGLYLAKHLVEVHRGDIWVELPSDGGTRVVFSLPVANDDE